MNSGDWIENLTALEYNEGNWSIYHYNQDPVAQSIEIDKKQKKQSRQEAMENLLAEMHVNGRH
jgi:hypothetical protein